VEVNLEPVAGPTCLYWAADANLCEAEAWCGHDSCQSIAYTSQDDSATCPEHGETFVAETGYNSGFAGEGVWWMRLACGCSEMEAGAYIP
jgi:hypothetical protein